MSNVASPVLGTDVILNPGASLSDFMAVLFPPPIPGAQHRPPWGQHLPPPITPAFPPVSSPVLPAFPTTPLVANGGRGPSAPGACNLTVQVRSQGRPVEAPQTQTFIITQGPLTWSAPGALSGSVACPAPVFLATPVMETIVTAPAVGVTQAGMGGWTPGFPPQVPPPAAQLAPIICPVNSGPWPHGTSREASLATNQPYTSQGDCSNPQSVYSNFRRWQRLKPLAQRHLPKSPDAEALSCFLIPGLRSLARLKPTMTLEWGLCRAVQEWQRISNVDRMIYYKIAEKFMEFEAEEEMQIQMLQWMQCTQDLPPPAPPKLDPRGPPAPKPHRSQQPPEPKAPKEIPPEAVREYMDIVEALVGPVHSATGESVAEGGVDGNELKQEEDGIYSDPGLLSYFDKLCSQEDFVTKRRCMQMFMEFEAEEEMQIQMLQWMQCTQDLPPPAPPKLDPRGPPAPKPHRSQQPPEPKAPKEIPPEAVREYMDIVEALVGPVHSATGESVAEGGVDGNELKQEEDGIYSDPGLLSYFDKLCSQEDFVTKVEAVIHPRFVAELLSPDAQLDLLALVEELEQEEGLTPEELVQKRLLALKEDEGVRADPSHSAPGIRSSPYESYGGQGAQRHDQDPHLGVTDEACPPEIDSEAPHRLIQTDTGLCTPKVSVPSRGRQAVSPFRAGRPSPPQGQRRAGPLPGPRDASVLREASPVREARGPRDGSGEDEEELPSLAFLFGSLESLLPGWVSQSPAHASGLASPGGWGARSAPQAPSPQRRGLSPAPPAAPKSRKRALRGRPASAEKLPIPGAGLRVSGKPALALWPARPSQPRKRKRDACVPEKSRKRRGSIAAGREQLGRPSRAAPRGA
ncbi:PREDICTED: NUT family member 2G-like [Lipotes vexillifer]|uniref:NUT family member 2G-like n=1 Tax=Lipotes vexillifer TaxID=118797 RepID=A0A340X5N8_LIPVE|nr:PREDICTED: NUT family member 2G-like [Lipotes vexillifer]